MKKFILFFSSFFILFSSINAKVPYQAGDLASDFSLKNVHDQMVSLSKFPDAKGFILVFTCNTCPVAKKYEQRIIDLHNKYSKEGFPVIAINSNDKEVSPGDSFEEMKKIAGDKGYKFEYLYDESQDIARRYGATNTPHVYILSRNGDKLKVEYVGAIDNNADDASKADKHYVADSVNSLLRGDKISTTGTKAIGCGIKWKKV